MAEERLRADLVLEYPFKRTTGPVIGTFLTGLREGVVTGVRYRDRPRRYVVLRVALMKSTVFPLFAYPVVACAPIYQFSDEERAFIDGLEMIDNTGNRMSKDTSILESEELAGVKAYIEEQLASYKTGLLRMKDENEIYITQSWSNKATSSQFHQRHKHPNSVISGVMYLGDNSDESLPPIRFHRQR